MLLLLLLSVHVVGADSKGMTVVNIGVVVDPTTRIGKEHLVGIEIATQDFNNTSKDMKISLYYGNSSTMDPLQAAHSAMELIKEKKVEAILGTQTGQEATLVEEIGNQLKVPIISLGTPPSTTKQSSSFLLKMTNNLTTQIRCIACLVNYHQWKKVVVIYEDDGYNSDITTLMLDQLSQDLQNVGSEIEYQLVLPPLALMTNPKEMITQQLINVLGIQSRVFVVFHLSLPLTTHLFKEANNMGLVGRETAWIVTDSIASLLHSLNSSTISYMEGTLGIKSYYNLYGKSFNDFKYKFVINFHEKYPQDDSFDRFGIHALRAYDAITIITKNIQKLGSNYSQDELFQAILKTNFNGLSGFISFKNAELEDETLKIINIVGEEYKELDICTSKTRFKGEIGDGSSKVNRDGLFKRVVYWPGDIDHVPRGWNTPVNARPLRIGVPGRTSFEKFVKVEKVGDSNRSLYTGFCIDIFFEVVKIIEESYALPYEFEAFNGTYTELVECVYNKTYDAAVGDITILANRWKKVEFTQPYIKSALSMIVLLKSKDSHKAILFMKPFSWQMWLVSSATLLYTMVIVWFLERRNNPHFGGSLSNQISAVSWFTFTSIFFAQKENVRSNLARISVAMWLFVVFVLTSSYAANLTSMLTIPLLEPKFKDYKSIVNSSLKVGCDGDSFVKDYLVNVLGFQPDNIRNVDNEYSYPELLANGTIAAAFIEHPYSAEFLHQYCKRFTKTKDYFRFEGQGFVFPKGSPLAVDVSKAILKLSENGVLKQLNDKWLSPSLECLSPSNNKYEVESLSIKVFSILYLFSCLVSTICFLIFIIKLLRGYRRDNQNANDVEVQSVWNSVVRFKNYYFYNGESSRTSERALDVPNTPPENAEQEGEWVPVGGFYSTSPSGELQMASTS